MLTLHEASYLYIRTSVELEAFGKGNNTLV